MTKKLTRPRLQVFLNVLLSITIVFSTANCTEAKPPVAIIGKGNVVKLEVAQTAEEITRGLMYRTSLPDDGGMVFLFDPPRPVSFWMYHTLIPLDMLYVKGGKIVKMYENVQPCKSEDPHQCPTYPSGDDVLVSEVIEVNAGYAKKHGIKEGDPVGFTMNPIYPKNAEPKVKP